MCLYLYKKDIIQIQVVFARNDGFQRPNVMRFVKNDNVLQQLVAFSEIYFFAFSQSAGSYTWAGACTGLQIKLPLFTVQDHVHPPFCFLVMYPDTISLHRVIDEQYIILKKVDKVAITTYYLDWPRVSYVLTHRPGRDLSPLSPHRHCTTHRFTGFRGLFKALFWA